MITRFRQQWGISGGIAVLFDRNAIRRRSTVFSDSVFSNAYPPSKANTQETMRSMIGKTILNIAANTNTVIGAVITNASLNKEEINKVAQMAQDGLARVIRPAHTMQDGDTIFALSTGKKKCDVNIVGAFAVDMVAQAIVDAVKQADAVEGLPSYKSIHAIE